MRPLLLSLATILFLTGSLSGEVRANLPPDEIPKTATVEILLLNAPGMDNEGSNWEIAYELRIANDATCWQAAKEGKFKGGSTERVGELLKAASVKRTIRSAEGRKAVILIPLSLEVQERLRNHPQEPVKIPAGKPTPEVIKLVNEQEMRSQTFLFYSVVSVYDAQLKKTRIIPVSFTWSYGKYPEALFLITLDIHANDSYSTKTALPKNFTGRQLEIRQ